MLGDAYNGDRGLDLSEKNSLVYGTGNLEAAFAAHVVNSFAGNAIQKVFTEEYTAEESPQVIVAGDFNDETGELHTLRFGTLPEVSAPANLIRTCCSDRDPYWMIPYDANACGIPNTKKEGEHGYVPNKAHLKPNCERPTDKEVQNMKVWDSGKKEPLVEGQYDKEKYSDHEMFLKWLGGYFVEPEEAGQQIHMNVAGASRKIYPDVPYMIENELGPVSAYPFASDLILSSEDFVMYGLPMGYQQDLFNPMSDHDPIIAAFKLG
jgi:hypothetical protein